MSENKMELGCDDDIAEVEAQVMSPEERIAVEIIESVPFSTEPASEVQALEWEFTGGPIMADTKDLFAEAERRVTDKSMREEVLFAIVKEKWRREKDMREAMDDQLKKRQRAIFEALDEMSVDLFDDEP